MAIPTVTFNNGKEIPILGLGTWKSKPGEVLNAVKWAIDAGYRHIDGAHVYENEKEVGAGIAAKIADGTVKREDLFIVSKLWNTSHPPELVEKALDRTLSDLGLDYLDLYLIHWPFAFEEGDALFPTKNGKFQFSDVDYVDTWKAMEKLLPTGKVRSIGISNFNKEQIERLLANSTIVPATNQVECHPWLGQSQLGAFCESKGIKITAYSPLGSPDRPSAKPDDPVLLDEPVVKELAKKHGKSPGQVLIRFQIEKGNIVIPKSVTESRIKSNIDVFNFKLSAEDMNALQGLEKGNKDGRCVAFDQNAEHKYYPFHADF